MSASLAAHNHVAIDFETADTQADSACALGLTRIVNGVVADSMYSLIRPPRPRVMFTHIHGLTWQKLKYAPTFVEIFPQFIEFIGSATAFVAHNASFDRRVLLGCCAAAHISLPPSPFLCTLKGSKSVLGLKKNKLSDVCTHLGITLQHHHAGSDAQAAAHIYAHLHALGVDDAQLYLS